MENKTTTTSTLTKVVRPTMLLLGTAGLILSGCYASGRPPENAKAAFQNVEHGTGKVLEGTGNLINAGVESADKSWKTPEEQRRKRLD